MTGDDHDIRALRAAIERTEPGAEINVDDVVRGVHASIADGRAEILTTDILRAALARIGGEVTSTDILRSDRDRDEPRIGATGREMHARLARSGPPLDLTMAGLPRRHQRRMSVSDALATEPVGSKSRVSADQPEQPPPDQFISAGEDERRTGEKVAHDASDFAPGETPAAMTADPDAERIRRYLDDLGRLSARHGVWIEDDARGTVLRVSEDHAAGYHACRGPAAGERASMKLIPTPPARPVTALKLSLATITRPVEKSVGPGSGERRTPKRSTSTTALPTPACSRFSGHGDRCSKRVTATFSRPSPHLIKSAANTASSCAPARKAS